MSILDRLTKKATRTAKETLIEDSRQDVAEKLDILGDALKVGTLLIVSFAAFRGNHHRKMGLAAHHDIDIPPVHVTNIYLGKEGM